MPDKNGRQTQRGAFRLIDGGGMDRRDTTARQVQDRAAKVLVRRRAA